MHTCSDDKPCILGSRKISSASCSRASTRMAASSSHWTSLGRCTSPCARVRAKADKRCAMTNCQCQCRCRAEGWGEVVVRIRFCAEVVLLFFSCFSVRDKQSLSSATVGHDDHDDGRQWRVGIVILTGQQDWGEWPWLYNSIQFTQLNSPQVQCSRSSTATRTVPRVVHFIVRRPARFTIRARADDA